MRPLHAVVIAVNKKTGLKLRTESGLIATLAYDKKYHTGESVLVSYDFTKNKVVRILEHKEEDMPEIEELGENSNPEDPSRLLE